MLNRPYMENFAKAGLKVEDIDYVLCTHLHVDHVGWNTRLDNCRWVPTFPNAKYVFSKTDRDYFDPTRGAGGKVPRQPQDHGFMYAHGYEDLDGHTWELVHMSGMPQQKQ